MHEKLKGDWFVNTETGDDSNNGTAKAPFKTIQKARDVATGSEVILITCKTFEATEKGEIIT